MIAVDTAALALHLRCTPSYVRLLVHEGILSPQTRQLVGPRGRPAMWFDLDLVDEAIRRAVDAGRVVLDQGRVRLRK